MKRLYYIMAVLALVLAPMDSVHAKGGGKSWLLGIDLSYLSTKSESSASGTTTSAEVSSTFYDVTLGYFVSPSFMVGAMYSTKNAKSEVSTSTTGTAMGLTLGYAADNGIHLDATYFLSATDDELKKGSGYQVDFGWRSYLSSSFFLGAKLSMRNLKFTDAPGYDSVSYTTTMPYISFGFGF